MLVSGINKTPIAKVLSSTLIKCRTPPAYAGNKTTIGLSFNGGFDFVSANESFQYISAVTVKQISPLYVPTSGGTMLTITGNNFIPNGNMSGAWRCSFDGTVVAATALSNETMTCFAPPMDVSRPVELLVSLNGVDYSKSGQQIL